MHTHILLINPLIQRREILFFFYCCYYRCIFQSTHPTQGDTAILHKNLLSYSYSIAKNHLFSLSVVSETLRIPRTNSKNDSYSSANPLHFLCELPVRTRMTFAIHSHLPRSYHITSFINDTFTIQKKILIRTSQSIVLCDSYDLFIK